MGKEKNKDWLKYFFEISDLFVSLLLKFITYTVYIIIIVLFFIYLTSFIYKDIFVYFDMVTKLSIWECIKDFFVFSLKYLLPPFVTIGGAYFIYRQWQIDKFMQFRDKIVIAGRSFRISSLKLEKKYIRTCNNDQLTDELWEEFSNDKEFIITEYLNELEAFALYIKYNIIDQHLAYEYGSHIITGILELKLLKTYIDEQQQINIDHYKYLILLAKKWIEVKNSNNN